MKILTYEKIDSTNDEAKRLAKQGVPEWTVVVADRQTKGRGRLGRRWHSDSGGLYLSVILRPPLRTGELFPLTLLMAVATVRTIRGLFNLEAMVKWPNDIVFGGKKLGGVLVETDRQAVIAGIGLNVNNDHFPEEIQKETISLKTILGSKSDPGKIVEVFVQEAKKLYQHFLKKGSDLLIEEWQLFSDLSHPWVKVSTPAKTYEGRILRLGSKGELIIKIADGKIKKFYSGEVTKVR